MVRMFVTALPGRRGVGQVIVDYRWYVHVVRPAAIRGYQGLVVGFLGAADRHGRRGVVFRASRLISAPWLSAFSDLKRYA